jgi:hypothetical protein
VLRLLVLAIAAIFRPKALLIAENLCLRQQLVVLQRRHPRPRLSDADRRFWILASRWFSDSRHPLLIVQPETVLGWQRAGRRAYRRWRSSLSLFSTKPICVEFYPRTSPITIAGDRTARWARQSHAARQGPSLGKHAERSSRSLCLAGYTTFTGLLHDKFLRPTGWDRGASGVDWLDGSVQTCICGRGATGL